VQIKETKKYFNANQRYCSRNLSYTCAFSRKQYALLIVHLIKRCI